MLTLHVEAETFAELSQKVLKEMGFLTQAITGSEEVAEVVADLPQDEAPRRTRRTKAQMEADAAASATSASGSQLSKEDDGSSDGSTVTTAASQEGDDAPTGYDYQTDIKPAVLRVSQKLGRPGVEALLAPYNVTNAQQIPAACYPELLKAVAKALED